MKHAPVVKNRGFAMLLVIAAVMIAAFALIAIQSSAFGQAAAGREALAKVRATWAARAGIEAAIARAEYDTENPDTADAFRLLDDLTAAARGELTGSDYIVRTSVGKSTVDGPADAHAKLNINAMTRDQLLAIEPFMSEDVADSILDWIDADDDTRELGAELGYYQSMPYPYLPRNGPFRSIAELELVAGVDPRDVRGEDWNLNGVLDDNEDDGDASWPPDNADGVLDAGWSGVLTAVSVDGDGTGASGQDRLDLAVATANDVASRIEASAAQAQVIVDYVAANEGATLGDFIRTSLSQMATQAAAAAGQNSRRVRMQNLTNEQLGALLDETFITPVDTSVVRPGKLNINTCDSTTIELLPDIEPELADAIIAERAARVEGFTSIAQLLEVPGMTRQRLASMYDIFCVRSNVFVVTCKGRDTLTGLEVEISATLDRSTVPVVIKDLTIR